MKGEPKGRKRIREPRAVYEATKRPATERSTAELDTRGRADWNGVQANRVRLEKQYAGRWIAVAKKRVVGDGVRLASALRQAKAKGVDHPLAMAFRPARLRDAVVVPLW